MLGGLTVLLVLPLSIDPWILNRVFESDEC
jgi:hypothetical protein